MKRFIFAIALAITAISNPALSADIGVSISIGQPGFYGQIELGNIARPQVVYTRPVIIQRAPRGVVFEPLYLRVPASHSSNWRRYCARYDACGRPVYFVRNDWYNNVYIPQYRAQHRNDVRDDRRDDRDDRNGRDNGNGRDNKNDRRDGNEGRNR